METDAGVAKQLLQEASHLERDIQQAIKEKKYAQVSSIRTKHVCRFLHILTSSRLSSAYEQLILSHYKVAVQKDIEQCLWKSCFYKAIEEYRSRVRQASQALAKIPGTRTKTDLQKICQSFRKFLESSTEFYLRLIHKLKTYYDLDLDNRFQQENNPFYQQYVSCHRCYVILGDLARYHRDLVSDPAQKNWTKAAEHYSKALKLWPENGHPLNQLAVLCAYKEDEFRTLYHYYRAMMAKIPFNTAKDNVVALFERNRAKFSGESKSSKKPNPDPKKLKVSEFFTIYVRMHGVLFTRTSVNTFCSLLQNASDLFLHLFNEGTFQELVLTHMMVVNIMTVHYLFELDEARTYVQATQMSEVQNLALFLSFAFFNNILGLSLELPEEESKKYHFFFKPISVFLSWLVTRPEFLRMSPETSEMAGLGNVLKNNLRQLVSRAITKVLKDSPFEEIEAGEDGQTSEEADLQGLIPFVPVIADVPPSGQLHGVWADLKRRKKIIKCGFVLAELPWTESENFISFSSETTSFLPSKELANPNIDNDLNKSNEVVVEKTVDIDYEDDANNVDEEINIDKRFDFIEDEDDDDLGEVILFNPNALRPMSPVSQQPQILLLPQTKPPPQQHQLHYQQTQHISQPYLNASAAPPGLFSSDPFAVPLDQFGSGIWGNEPTNRQGAANLQALFGSTVNNAMPAQSSSLFSAFFDGQGFEYKFSANTDEPPPGFEAPKPSKVMPSRQNYNQQRNNTNNNSNYWQNSRKPWQENTTGSKIEW